MQHGLNALVAEYNQVLTAMFQLLVQSLPSRAEDVTAANFLLTFGHFEFTLNSQKALVFVLFTLSEIQLVEHI